MGERRPRQLRSRLAHKFTFNDLLIELRVCAFIPLISHRSGRVESAASPISLLLFPGRLHCLGARGQPPDAESNRLPLRL